MVLRTVIIIEKHLNVNLNILQSVLIALFLGILLALCGQFLIMRLRIEVADNFHDQFTQIEKIFGLMMIFPACAMAFAHGSNDVANAVGPVAAIVSIVSSGGEIAQESVMPIWILLLGSVGIVAGLLMYGYKVIATVGSRITELTPSRGFCCNLAAAITVVLASGTGIPISTTHTLVGAVLGVGFARGISALNLRIVGSIFMSWIITLPAGGIMAIVFFYFLVGIFN